MALHNVLLHRLIEEWNHSALGSLLASMLNDPRMQTTTAHNILILSRIVSFKIL